MGKTANEAIAQIEEDDGPITNFGASYVFERALRRYDIQAEQRKLQQNKYDSQLSKIENDNQALEYKLAKKETDFVRISDKCRSLQKQLVDLRTENDILDMKLRAEVQTTHRLNRDVEKLQWVKQELLDLVNRSEHIDELRKKILNRKLYFTAS